MVRAAVSPEYLPCMTLPRVILASQSPRRRELLSLIGIAHEVQPAHIDETPLERELPTSHSERLARGKASLIAAREPGALVIGADTVVVVGDTILGKPGDDADARDMLSRLSGRTHQVYTAVAVARDGIVDSEVEGVSVTFRTLTRREIDAYVATGETRRQGRCLRHTGVRLHASWIASRATSSP